MSLMKFFTMKFSRSMVATLLAQCKREKVVWLCDTTASALQITFDASLALQLSLQQNISSKTVAEKLTLHPSLSILDITHINYNNFIVSTSATMQFCKRGCTVWIQHISTWIILYCIELSLASMLMWTQC